MSDFFADVLSTGVHLPDERPEPGLCLNSNNSPPLTGLENLGIVGSAFLCFQMCRIKRQKDAANNIEGLDAPPPGTGCQFNDFEKTCSFFTSDIRGGDGDVEHESQCVTYVSQVEAYGRCRGGHNQIIKKPL